MDLKHCFKWQIKSILILSWIFASLRTTYNDLKASTNHSGNTRCHQVTGTQTAQRFSHRFIQTSVNKTIRNQTKFQNTGQIYKATISSLLHNWTYTTTRHASTATLFIVYKIPVTFFLRNWFLKLKSSFPTNYFSLSKTQPAL